MVGELRCSFAVKGHFDVEESQALVHSLTACLSSLWDGLKNKKQAVFLFALVIRSGQR